MAGDEKKGLLGRLLPGGGRADDPDATLGVVRDDKQIRDLLISAMGHDSSVTVHIPGERRPYYTLFPHDEAAQESVREGRGVIIEPVDPPVGNIRMRQAGKARLDFFTQRYIVQVELPYLGTTEQRSLKLGYPTEVWRGMQKRAGIRVKVDHRQDLPCTVIRPSGLSFDAKIVDISNGGVAFYSLSREAKLGQGLRAQIVVFPPEAQSVRLEFVVLGMFQQEGRTCYRCKFVLGTSALVRAAEELAAHCQRAYLRRRGELFN